MRRILTTALAMGVAAASLVAAGPAQAQTTVAGGGASFSAIFMQECAKDFNAGPGAGRSVVQYASVGSSAGLRGFANGTYAFGGTDAAYTTGKPTFPWSYVPIAGGGISIPINLKGTNGRPIGGSINLSQENLAKIFAGQIPTWNNSALKKDNERIWKLMPNTPVTVVYRADGSGTTNNFLQYLNGWRPDIFGKVQNDMSTAFPGGNPPVNSLSGPQNAGVMGQVALKDGAIGYVDLGDALKANATVANVQNTAGEFVKATTASIAKNLAEQTNVSPEGLVTLNYKVNAKGAYPIGIFTYALGRVGGGTPASTGSADFVKYMINTCGSQRASALGYVPLEGKILDTAKTLAAKLG
ncbi:MAG: substrate-binding domain-containing protein [Actinomycetales bacterium]|nr:substrate-binding domain-containing protein [Actinomycetales bacterium]